LSLFSGDLDELQGLKCKCSFAQLDQREGFAVETLVHYFRVLGEQSFLSLVSLWRLREFALNLGASWTVDFDFGRVITVTRDLKYLIAEVKN
jgi:hypothetical protein